MNRKHESETRARYGNTAVYREYKAKTGSYVEEKWDAVNIGMKQIFDAFCTCKAAGFSPSSTEAQALVRKLQAHITENYYTCTDEILAGLGKLYVSDARFERNIDKSGEGTARFVSEAISLCVGER